MSSTYQINVDDSRSFAVAIWLVSDGSGHAPNNTGDNTRVTFDEARLTVMSGVATLSSGDVLTDSTYSGLTITPKHVGLSTVTVEYGSDLSASGELVQAEASFNVEGISPTIQGVTVAPQYS